MLSDEIVYLGILAASISVGFLFRYLGEYLENLKYLTKNKKRSFVIVPF